MFWYSIEFSWASTVLDERQFGSATEHMYRSSLFDRMPCSLSLHWVIWWVGGCPQLACKSKQHTRQTIQESERQTVSDGSEIKYTPPQPNKCLGKLLEKSGCNPAESRTPRRYPPKGKINYDSGPDDRGHEMWKHQQPDTTAGGHPSVQVVKEIRRWYNSERNVREIRCKSKQLALYITSRKYLGGTDRKALAKKQRATEDEPEPATSQ